VKIRDRAEYASKPRPLTCAPDTMVGDAVRNMAAMDYGSIVVVDAERRVLGLVTERDILKRVVDEGRDPGSTAVESVMTADVRTAREDDNLYDWLRIMSNERFRRLPIVDAENRLVSVMTQGDFVSYTWPELMTQASTIARSSLSANYQILLALGGVGVYTALILALVAAVF